MMTEYQIKQMVDRFLGWRLPTDFNPDNGISYKRPNYHPSLDARPQGTNLFGAEQAEAMVRYMVAGLPPEGVDLAKLQAAESSLKERNEEVERLREVVTRTRALVSEGAESGFSDHDWMERLFRNQASLSAVLS